MATYPGSHPLQRLLPIATVTQIHRVRENCRGWSLPAHWVAAEKMATFGICTAESSAGREQLQSDRTPILKSSWNWIPEMYAFSSQTSRNGPWTDLQVNIPTQKGLLLSYYYLWNCYPTLQQLQLLYKFHSTTPALYSWIIAPLLQEYLQHYNSSTMALYSWVTAPLLHEYLQHCNSSTIALYAWVIAPLLPEYSKYYTPLQLLYTVEYLLYYSLSTLQLLFYLISTLQLLCSYSATSLLLYKYRGNLLL